MKKKPAIIDADGHLHEDAQGIASRLPSPFGDMRIFSRPNFPYRNLFPPIDHLHTSFRESPATLSGRGRIEPVDWLRFLDDVGIETTVLYPSSGLASGRTAYVDEAVALCTAYNDWVSSSYAKFSPRFRPVGLLPMQDPEAAVAELRRIVTKLGLVGAMLPANGLKGHLGSREYWPVYEEANRLECALGIHGGVHSGLGLDHMTQFAAVHGLGHPFGVMVSFAGLVGNGVFDRFPNARFGFLEAGVAWMLLMIERLSGSNRSFTQPDPRGHLLKLKGNEQVRDYIKRHVEAGRIYIGSEGDEPSLPHAISMLGNRPFLFSSDFPHEVTNETCKEEIHELQENEALTDADKDAVLGGNAVRFYNLKGR
ncbi:MAG: amidohydrolase [Chloroflexi bacterium]|nr:amidohydrolase [Chloroflexota bacterium]